MNAGLFLCLSLRQVLEHRIFHELGLDFEPACPVGTSQAGRSLIAHNRSSAGMLGFFYLYRISQALVLTMRKQSTLRNNLNIRKDMKWRVRKALRTYRPACRSSASGRPACQPGWHQPSRLVSHRSLSSKSNKRFQYMGAAFLLVEMAAAE